MNKPTMTDKGIGSLVGGAVGDALGYPVEFVPSYQQIENKFGAPGVRDYILDLPWLGSKNYKREAQFSDDTQMTMYTAEGLLHAIANDRPVVPMITNAYLQWYSLQTGRPVVATYPSEWAKIDEANQRRAPGNTCISALWAINDGYAPDNNSKGCGGIMRIAPVAIYGATHGWTVEQTAKLAGQVAEITHLHPLSTISSACCAAIIHLCMLSDDSATLDGFGRIVNESIACVEGLYPTVADMEYFKNLIRRAMRQHDSQLEDWQVIEQGLGGGWVAEETLAIAVYSVARHISNFEDCMVCAVNHGGDSDSTGAVAGNIIGAILGIDAIPAKYTDDLQLNDTIVDTAAAIIK